jgi:hypothetical protein
LKRLGRIWKGISVRWTAQREGVETFGRFRYALWILAFAAVSVFVLEPLILSGTTPLVAQLSAEDRGAFYGRIIPISGSLLGFYIAAVSILAQLDPGRKIVSELKRGESFSLLIANMLVTILLLFLLTFVGLAGSLDTGCRLLMALYEWLLLSTVIELVFSGLLFSVVTYKVAVDRRPSGT